MLNNLVAPLEKELQKIITIVGRLNNSHPSFLSHTYGPPGLKDVLYRPAQITNLTYLKTNVDHLMLKAPASG